MNVSQAQLDYLREYAPDVVAALTNLGQTSAYYDANGHYARTQPDFFAFGLNGSNQLTAQPASARGQGLQVVHNRCPGGAVQPTPDGSAPWLVPGCTLSSTPPGP
jgi:phospholipid/cholesterol/gamma-HCH transport system substrate-binding protein